MARMIHCIKLDKEAEGLDFPPYPGELGKKIYEKVSKEAWAGWLKHQTMLVNENRLNLADARARRRRQGHRDQGFRVHHDPGRRGVWLLTRQGPPRQCCKGIPDERREVA